MMTSISQLRIKLGTIYHLKRAHFWLNTIGNSLGAKLNFLYFIHHSIAKAASLIPNNHYPQPTGADFQLAKQLKEKGFVKIDGIEIEALAEIAKSFDHGETETDRYGLMAIPKKRAHELAPFLEQSIRGKIEAVLNAYYGSHFQFYTIVEQRLDATKRRQEEDSFLFHLDDQPVPFLKVFYYLNDTYESNGAFRTFDYETSAQLIRNGFISLSIEHRTSSQSLISPDLKKNKLNILEGKKGTALIFDANIIHKGTWPREGHRDVVAFQVFPSNKRVDRDNIEKAFSVKVCEDFPKNPFKYNSH